MLETTHPAMTDEVMVSLDLETTGLDFERDAIIEVGVVKFRGHEVLDTFQTFVNCYQPLSEFIRRLTGIGQSDVDRAPPFPAISEQLTDFIGDLPIVGHNHTFDMTFLSKNGLRLKNETFDTWDLAAVILPEQSDYSLIRLAALLGVEHTRPHRALSDAQATHGVMVRLVDRAALLDPGVLAAIEGLGNRGSWTSGRLIGQARAGKDGSKAEVGLGGLDMDAVAARLRRQPGGRPDRSEGQLDEDELAGYLGPDGLFSNSFPGFEHRAQQVEMLRGVVRAFNEKGNLMVEAGTGVGKSIAYLLPAILFSAKSGERVVVSTNTINLQEQLLKKDIPALVSLLEEAGLIGRGEFRTAPLKGRGNYLCLRRWGHMARGDGLTAEEARILSKSLVWLQDTSTGDRSEMNLAGRDAMLWSRISAGDRGACPGNRDGPCFLRASRERAEGANLVVVNHALLLADLAMGRSILPHYKHLIVDEAHHLEEEATRQLGFQVSQGRLNDLLDILGKMITEARLLQRSLGLPREQAQIVEQRVAALEGHLPRVRENWGRFWGAAQRFLENHAKGGEDRAQVSLDRSTRTQPAWSELEIDWENVDLSLGEAASHAGGLRSYLHGLSGEGPLDPETVAVQLESWQADVEELRERLSTLMSAAHQERIDWMLQDGESGALTLHSAPMDVSSELANGLYSGMDSVILTSATLSTQGSFDYMRERVGLEDAQELLVGSPFDYKKAALLLIPENIPGPNQGGYQDALSDILAGLGVELDGHTLALFTSHASLRAAARAIRSRLESADIKVLAQGVDGSARRVLEDFTANSRCVLLGTSSLWEGVDLPGDILRAVVVTRLPFHVPTEPIFAARSELYEDAFNQYALPQAVLRFRQGVGRLIRGSGDRGVIIVLDQRVVSRSYGKVFLSSAPPCTMKRTTMSAIPSEASRWVRG